MAMAPAGRRLAVCVTRLLEQTAGRAAVRPALESAASTSGIRGIHELRPSSLTRPLIPRLRVPLAQHMSCCAGVDAPRAPEIIIEYDEGAGDNNDFFIRLADDIENRFPELSVLGNPDELEARPGTFEVSRDGQVLFSMLQSKRLPSVEELIEAIETSQSRCEITRDSAAASG